MTAEIVPFPSPRRARAIVDGLPPVPQMPAPVNALAFAAVAGKAPTKSVAIAAQTLVAACRELAANLTILGAHCQSADSAMAEIGDGAAEVATMGPNPLAPEPVIERPRRS